VSYDTSLGWMLFIGGIAWFGVVMFGLVGPNALVSKDTMTIIGGIWFAAGIVILDRHPR
jgi:hypothetical protein